MTPCDWLSLAVLGCVLWWVFVVPLVETLLDLAFFWWIERRYGEEFTREVKRELGKEDSANDT